MHSRLARLSQKPTTEARIEEAKPIFPEREMGNAQAFLAQAVEYMKKIYDRPAPFVGYTAQAVENLGKVLVLLGEEQHAAALAKASAALRQKSNLLRSKGIEDWKEIQDWGDLR
jgi:hypothetical protein